MDRKSDQREQDFLSGRLQRVQFYLTELILEMEARALTHDIIVEKVKEIVRELRQTRSQK